MIDSLALGPDGRVFSIARIKGRSHILEHEPGGSRSFHDSSDRLYGLWVSPSGAIHVGGKGKTYTNRTGAWKPTKIDGHVFAMWGASDEELFAGTLSGDMLRLAGGVWSSLGKANNLISCVTGRSSSEVYFASFDGLSRFDGTSLAQIGSKQALKNVVVREQDLLVCSMDQVMSWSGPELASVTTIVKKTEGSELQKVGVSRGGMFVHQGPRVYRVAGDKLELVIDSDRLMLTNASYSTAMTSNGARVVAGAPAGVFVEDGEGFVEWAGLPEAGSAPAKATKKR